MSSKLKLSAAIVSLSLLTSCTVPWGEDPAKPAAPETKLGQEARCLSGLTPIIVGFMDGSAPADKVSGAWTCFDDALGLFERKVRGENPRHYTAREVARFFEDYFLDPDVKINDRLLVEIMRFKQLFVGGDNQLMTREELTKLREFARQMRALSLELLPQMQLLSMNWKVTGDKNFAADLARFETAKAVGTASVEKLAALIEPQQQKYEIQNFVVLLEELQKVFKTDWSFTKNLKRMLPLLTRLKGALTGTQEAVIQPKDWRKFGGLGARSYLQYLRYYYFFENNPHREKDPELILVFRSVDDLLGMVGDILTQKASAQLQRDEIISVLRAVADVFPQFTIPESFVDEILKVKKLLFGGEISALTPADLSRARVKLENFRTLANLLLKNSLILEGKWKPELLPNSQARIEFEGAEKGVLEFMQVLSPLLESDYDLRDFGRLIESFELAFPPKKPEEAFSPRIQKLMPLALKAKALVLATEGSIVKQADWPFLTEVLGKAYLRLLEYEYFLKDASFFRSPGLPQFEIWVRGLSDVLEATFRARGRGEAKGISVSELQSAVKAFDAAGYWPEVFPADAANDLIPILIKRALTPPADRARGKYQTGLGPVGLQVVNNELKVYFSVQKKMDALLTADPRLSHGDLQRAFAKNDSLGDSEMMRLVQGPVPLAFDAQGRLFLGAGSQIAYSESSLNRINLLRAGVRWAIRAYGSTSSADKLHGLTEEQFQRAFMEFRPGLVSMGLIDPTNTTFATSRFLEGNLFTPYSDGDNFLDYNEAGTLAILILSGQTVYGQMKADIHTHCRVKNTKTPYYGVDCALEVMRRRSGKAFAAMPRMVQLFQGDKARNIALLDEVLRASGWVPNAQRIAKSTELSLVPHVIQYIESLFRRWDRDGNAVLDRTEAMRAYPMFQTLLKKVSNLDDESYVKAAYAYILVNGKPPETFWEKFDFASNWVNKEDKWPISADRYRISNILGFIADSVRKGNAAAKKQIQQEDRGDQRSR
ncbi:MAG: hypothetical protein KF767_07720 [Bdellovibrionaceae bacterium]|nr:hypothetical protein [Pseudobdellovibrionaceae bacterium]